jgi:Tfp pilus assembly protein FimT
MNSRRCAMSLFEVTLVIFVIGILAAITAPRFADSLRVAKLESAARQLAAHIEYVRRVAINQGRTTTLICNNNDQTYASDIVDFPDRIGVPMLVALQQVYDSTLTLEANFDSSTDLSFDLEGIPRVGSSALVNGKITLRSGSQEFTVTVAAGTGATSVHRSVDGAPIVVVDSSGSPDSSGSSGSKGGASK